MSETMPELEERVEDAVKAVTKSEVDGEHPASHYLVVEDAEKPSTWHLRVRNVSGELDHRLMGAAWAALHEGYRGNKYEGPQKDEALRKLRALYEREGMPLPSESKSLDDDLLIAFGSEVKAMGNGRLGGYLVRFTDDHDLDGEAFGKDTDFGPHRTTRVLYHHGADRKMGLRVLDEDAQLKIDDEGVWIEAQLELRDKYERYIYAMAESGKLGWSSGTAKHLVQKAMDKGVTRITSWPLGLDASLTPTPCEPRNRVIPLKAVEVADLELAEELAEAQESAPVKASEVRPVSSRENRSTMNEQMEKTETKAPLNVDDIAESLWAKLTKRLDEEPAYQKAFVQNPEGSDRPAEKSLGDFLVAVQRGDTKRLSTVYKSGLSEASGESGGYLVPPEFARDIFAVAQEQAVFRRCNPVVIQMNSREFNYPVLDYTGTEVGMPHRLAGVMARWTEEAQEKQETEPSFRSVRLVYHELSGYTVASSMLQQDAPALESVLRQLFGQAIAFLEDWSFLRGTGAGQPLGVFNSPALLTEAAPSASFVLSDAANMMARFLSRRPFGGTWLMHPRMISHLIQMADGASASNNLIWLQNAKDNIGALTLFGNPIYFTETMPPPPPGSSAETRGGVLLIDGSYYAIGDRSRALTIDYSPHARFTTNQGAWRFCKYFDGQPLINSPVTLADGSWTVSPFVTLAGA